LWNSPNPFQGQGSLLDKCLTSSSNNSPRVQKVKGIASSDITSFAFTHWIWPYGRWSLVLSLQVFCLDSSIFYFILANHHFFYLYWIVSSFVILVLFMIWPELAWGRNVFNIGWYFLFITFKFQVWFFKIIFFIKLKLHLIVIFYWEM